MKVLVMMVVSLAGCEHARSIGHLPAETYSLRWHCTEGCGVPTPFDGLVELELDRDAELATLRGEGRELVLELERGDYCDVAAAGEGFQSFLLCPPSDNSGIMSAIASDVPRPFWVRILYER